MHRNNTILLLLLFRKTTGNIIGYIYSLCLKGLISSDFIFDIVILQLVVWHLIGLKIRMANRANSKARNKFSFYDVDWKLRSVEWKKHSRFHELYFQFCLIGIYYNYRESTVILYIILYIAWSYPSKYTPTTSFNMSFVRSECLKDISAIFCVYWDIDYT